MKSLNQKQWIAVSVSLIVIAIFFLSRTFIFSFFTQGVQPGVESEVNYQVENQIIMDSNETSGLKTSDLIVGTGETAVAGKILTVNYVGTLTDGRVFDSSYTRGEPFQFVLGAGQVISGWDMGLTGMKVGGKRKLLIPSELAYGSQSVGGIPANSILVFEVELLKAE